MTKWIQKSLLSTCALTCLNLMAGEPVEQEPCNALGLYFGGFGGWVFPYHVDGTQKGTAYFSDAAGGPLSVNAPGNMSSNTKGFGGVHIGYERRKTTCGFRIVPGIELEGLYFANTKKGFLDNPTDRVDAHEFIVTLPMRIGAILVNGTLAFETDYVTPYIGAGIGAGFVSIHGADSAQIDPPEPGINHFNSDPDDFDTTFATQGKAGLRYPLFKYMRIFAEYRFLYLASSDYTFGSTKYPTHVATSKWKFDLSGMRQNACVLGLDFTF